MFAIAQRITRSSRLLFLTVALCTLGCGGALGQSSDVVVQIEGATNAKPTALKEIVLHEPNEAAYVGDLRIDGDEATSSGRLTFYADGVARSMQIEMYDRTVKQSEILEMRGERVLRWKVRYGTADSTVTINGVPQDEKTMPVLKKPYIVDLRSGQPRVTDENGKDVPKDEREAVIRMEVVTKKKKVNRPGPRPTGPVVDDSPRGKKYRVGDELPWLAQYLEREFTVEGSDSKMEATVSRARLLAVYDIDGDECAVVDIAMDLTRDETEGTHTETQLEGQVVMRANDGALIGMTVSGPKKTRGAMKVDGQLLRFGGSGSIKLRARRRWEARGPSAPGQ